MRTRTACSSAGGQPAPEQAPWPATTAIVLAGGRGRRLGGCDKPLLEVGGRPLVAHVLARIVPQVNDVVLACSRSAAAHQRFGWPVVADEQPDQGPLAGFAAALATVRSSWTLVVAADTPFLPLDLVARLAPSCHRHGAAVASAGGRRQNLTMLLAAPKAQALAAFFAAGGRAAKRWLDAESVPTAEFDADAFRNVNTAADLAAVRALCADSDSPATAPGTGGL